jgi:hypothetical protein
LLRLDRGSRLLRLHRRHLLLHRRHLRLLLPQLFLALKRRLLGRLLFLLAACWAACSCSLLAYFCC